MAGSHGHAGAVRPEAFVGAWDLVSWTIALADGRVTRPFGEAPIGMIAYTAAGTVHAHFSRSDRTRLGLPFDRIQAVRRHLLGLEKDAPEGVDVDAVTGRFLRAALEFNGYCGTYETDGDTVRHRVVAAVIPEWEGCLLERQFAFEDDRLVLSTDAPLQRDRLVWRRRQDASRDARHSPGREFD